MELDRSEPIRMTTQFDGSSLAVERKQPEMIEIDDDDCCISPMKVVSARFGRTIDHCARITLN